MTTDDLLAITKKQPVGFACAVLCLICGGLLYFRSDKIAENQAEYEAKSTAAAKTLDNVRNSEKLPAQVTEIEALSKEMDSRLVRAGQLAVNLQYFYKLEAETEVKLIDVRQNAVAKGGKGPYVGIPFNVAVQGTFKQVMSFLQKLENGPHFCRFTSVNFTKAVAGADPTGMTITINIELLGVP